MFMVVRLNIYMVIQSLSKFQQAFFVKIHRLIQKFIWKWKTKQNKTKQNIQNYFEKEQTWKTGSGWEIKGTNKWIWVQGEWMNKYNYHDYNQHCYIYNIIITETYNTVSLLLYCIIQLYITILYAIINVIIIVIRANTFWAFTMQLCTFPGILHEFPCLIVIMALRYHYLCFTDKEIEGQWPSQDLDPGFLAP